MSYRAAILFLMTLGVGCAGPEGEVLTRFFHATRSGDGASVAGFSAVAFPGEPESWRMEEVVSDRREPFALPELKRAVDSATKARDAQFEAFTQFRLENVEELKAVLDAVEKKPDTRFNGKRADLYAAYEKHRDERRGHEEELAAASRKANAEARLAAKSLLKEEDVGRLAGEVWVREVRVRVGLKGGEEKPYRFTMKKYVLSAGAAQLPSRWIITGIEAS